MSENTKVNMNPEIKASSQVKASEVTNHWDDNLGPNQTNIINGDGSFVRHGNADPAKIALPVQNISYTYNDFLELTTVTETNKDGATKYTYSYDNAGNITYEKVEKGPDIEHLTQVESHGYEYKDSAWKDKLTGYDTKGIEYDGGGKPVKYLGKSMEWNSINDRLVSVKESGKQDINYSYLSDGKRYAVLL